MADSAKSCTPAAHYADTRRGGTSSWLKYHRTPQAAHTASPAETLVKMGAICLKQY